MPCPMGRGTMHRGAMHWGARVMGNLAKRVDWQGRKEGNRVDAGSGQRKAPQGKPYGAGGGIIGLLVNRCQRERREP
jgi:hypothetical protein